MVWKVNFTTLCDLPLNVTIFITHVRKCVMGPTPKWAFLYPRYEVYRGYIVFAFSVIMFVCLSICLFVC